MYSNMNGDQVLYISAQTAHMVEHSASVRKDLHSNPGLARDLSYYIWHPAKKPTVVN